MNRFARYKALQALWYRARTLLALFRGPLDQHGRLRAQRWQQIQVAERQIADGIVRGTEDPDARMRPSTDERREYATRAWQAHQVARSQWQADWQRRQQGHGRR